MPIPVSCVIIAYNEADMLPRVLETLTWCDDIVVMDSGSTDDTAAKAESYGARVFQREFDGFGQQKQAGADLARYDWILSLDADEIPTPEFQNALFELFESGEPQVKAWFIRRRLVFQGKTFNIGKESRDYQLRLFDRREARWSEDAVHEHVLFEGKKGKINIPVDHHSYRSLDNFIGKLNRYTSLASVGAKSSSWLMICFRYHFTFCKRFWLELNFLNGYPGWLWSRLSASYNLVKYAKRKEV